MVRRTGDVEPEPNLADRDERIGEAIEAYLALAETGQAPDPSSFAAKYPDLEEDLLASLDGLALVQGLVGETSGPGHRLESGRRVAGYRIVRELGRGGMGIVYEAVHVGLDRPVALKVLGSSAAPDSSGRRRFLNEARTAAGLHHTHIVPVFDVGQVGGLCYYAMQRIEGSGLDRVIKHLRRDRSVAAGSTYPGRTPLRHPTPHVVVERETELSGMLGDSTATWAGRGSMGLSRDLIDEPTPFEPQRGTAYYRWVATVGKQAAEALAHAHQRGVIHRDVKPSNLLVDARGVIWMADFGLARRLADPSQTQVDSLLGTPRYMSPEQANTGALDGRSDVYSLGATLYELLTLRPPFEGKTAAELIGQIASREPAPLRQFDKRIPRDLETIVLKALNKRAQDRYETAAELADDLERYLNHEPVRARRIGPIGRAWRVARRNRLLTTVSALAIAAVLISTTINYVNILYERNEAVKARGETQQANLKLETAIGETQTALQLQLVQNAEVVRLSAVANRRSTGLGLLKRAAELPTALNQRILLRDEAVAFLTIRDVEGRPGITLPDPAQTFVFAQDGQHLATLAEDGTTLRFWDVEKRNLINTQEIAVDLTRLDDPSRPRGPRRFGQGPGGNRGLSRLAAAGEDIALVDPDGRGIRLYNAATGAVSGNLRLFERPAAVAVGPAEPDREIMAIAFSADGQRFLTVDRAAIELDFSRPRRTDGESPRMGGGGNDPRGRIDVRVHLWNALKPARPIATVFEPKIETRTDLLMRGWLPLFAIAPDGKTVAVASVSDAEISIWTKDGTIRDTIDSQAELTALALGSQGLLAAAGNRAVHLWDLNNLDNTRASLPSINPNLGFVDQLRFNPDDSSLLAVSGRGSGVEIWDISATAKVASLPIIGEWHGMAVGPKNKLLAIAQGSSLAFWEVVSPQALTEISSFPDRLKTVAFSPGGDLAMVDGQGNLRLWTNGECPAKSHVNEQIKASSITFDHQGKLIAQILGRVDPRGRQMGPSTDRLDWLDIPGLKTSASIPLPEPTRLTGNRGGGGFRITAPRIARASNDQMLVMIRFNEILLARPRLDGGAMSVVRLESPDLPDLTPGPGRFDGPPPSRNAGAERGPQQPRASAWRDVVVNPAGTRVYLLSFGAEEFSAWSLKGTKLERLNWSIPGRYSSIALSDDGGTLALGDRQGTVLIIDAQTGRPRLRLNPPETDKPAPVDAIAFAPNQSLLAVGTSGEVLLWNLNSSDTHHYMRLLGHRGPVTALAFDPTGDRLATGGDDRSVRVWDLKRVHAELSELGLDR